MITEQTVKAAFGEMVKTLYKKVFQRDITQEELDTGFKNLFSRMSEDLKEIRGFSDSQFERYMTAKGNELLFSPTCIYDEIARVINTGGEDELTHSGKYKKLREMELAARLCFANYKLREETFLIKIQDSPDITLALAGSASREIEILHVEIMTIPAIVKEKMETNLPIAIADFIKDKKFLKDYGRCSLLINFDFNHTGLDYTKISQAIQSAPNNPYESIWIVFVSDQEGGMSVIQIHPKNFKVEYNLRKEKLFY